MPTHKVQAFRVQRLYYPTLTSPHTRWVGCQGQFRNVGLRLIKTLLFL
jgi:hypothetical protein